MGDFFFSSRRRHTRYWRDWSSDVCSSDLISSCRACFPDGPWDAATLERILTLAGGFGYLAWQEDIPVGFILARDLAGEVEVLSVGVLPQWRRRGVGRALIDAVVAKAERDGLGSIVLEVAAENEAARRLYA